MIFISAKHKINGQLIKIFIDDENY